MAHELGKRCKVPRSVLPAGDSLKAEVAGSNPVGATRKHEVRAVKRPDLSLSVGSFSQNLAKNWLRKEAGSLKRRSSKSRLPLCVGILRSVFEAHVVTDVTGVTALSSFK